MKCCHLCTLTDAQAARSLCLFVWQGHARPSYLWCVASQPGLLQRGGMAWIQTMSLRLNTTYPSTHSIPNHTSTALYLSSLAFQDKGTIPPLVAAHRMCWAFKLAGTKEECHCLSRIGKGADRDDECFCATHWLTHNIHLETFTTNTLCATTYCVKTNYTMITYNININNL